ncbi:MAG: amino acid adenylation domain-containing protein, partial [Chloroflexi bacterium]|nr:amino acid adenylation domain-containing protein [Chloroflexota bacterium]
SLPTSFWNMLVTASADDDFALPATIRLVIIGGEHAELARVRQWQARFGATVLLANAYGPTETTVAATAYVVPPVLPSDLHITPIGQPLAGLRAYVLDAQMQLVPIGVGGELYVGGASLARGYLSRPDLTATQFVPDRFSHPEGTRPGARLYRTGDRVRYRADGNLEFLGRIDQQVKLRGFRIELGEIEAVLRSIPAIRDAHVMVRHDDADDPRLVAYVVPEQNQEPRTKNLGEEQRTDNKEQNTTDLPSPAAAGEGPGVRASSERLIPTLRTVLQQRLPAYMVPSAFVVLDALPLTPSDKVDRAALPAPEFERGAAAVVAPRSETERLIAEVWAGVLRVEQLSIHDNFFELGGHSLLATQVVSRVRQLTGQEIPLRLLFEAPTVAGFAAYLAQHEAQSAETAEVQATEREAGPIPLSFAQQRLWFFDQLQPGSNTYSIPAGVRIRGPLDAEALRRSLSTVVQRHEILRTTFEYDAAAPLPTPYQRIAPPSELEMPIVTLPIANDQAIAELVQAEMERPFDLQTGPLLRATLFRSTPDDHILVLVMHHGIFDGWSQSIFLRELIALYRGFVAGETVDLPPLRLQYADYALWQREWMQSAVREEQMRFWRQTLANAPMLDLPTDYPRPPTIAYHGAHVPIRLSPALTQPLQRLSQRLHSTMFMTLLAAFQALRYRYSGQTDLSIGTPIAGRTRPEFEDVIGPFANTVVVRTDLGGAPSFEQLVERVRKASLDAYAHQDVPFEMLVEELQPERDLSIHPLFQVMFTFQNTPNTALVLPDLSFQSLAADLETTKVDLIASFSDANGRVSGMIGYRTDLFAQATIENLAQHFELLLTAALANPQQPIATLPLLTEHERGRLFFEWNTPAIDVVQDALIHEQIAEQAARTPDALAVIGSAESLTYRELNARANQLAHYLRGLGVGPDLRVGLCMERSPDLIVALLGILKAGGAYVPLDPAYPPARLQFMVADSGIAALVTQASLLGVVPSYSGTIVCVDRDQALIAEQPMSAPRVAAQPDNLAYIIYTSGSTGMPKGVMITHRALVSYVSAAQERYAITSQDRMLQFASITFDASAEEIYTSLTGGATLVLRSEEMLATPETFFSLCQSWQLSVVSLPTAFWHLLAEAVADGALLVPEALRLVIIGGERVSPARVAQWQAQLGDRCGLINTYGPTETTIVATSYAAPASFSAELGEIPIGRPLANLRAYVLDEGMQPVPIGGRGELCIGGIGLARGYLNRPELTAEKFVPDPFSGDLGTRLYRTGDQARYLPDGNIEFLGRIDHQVKLRGFRVEPGEIEAVLRQHPDVREAVIQLLEERAGEKRLVAYVVGEQTNRVPSGRTNEQSSTTDSPSPAAAGEGEGRRPGDEGLTRTLRAHVKEHLPDYMVPSAFVLLEALPLTPSGKVDRQALPKPDLSYLDVGEAFVAPRTPLEELIAGVWATVFNIERVSVHDNFFTLGGHSLLATQVITRVRHLTGRDVPLRLLFEAPTIAAVAEQIDAHAHAVDVPLVAVPRDGLPIPLSFAQQRLWYLDQLQPGTTLYSIPVAIQLAGPLDVAALEQSLAAILDRHEVLRTTFAYDPTASDPGPFQQIAPAGGFALPVVALPPDADAPIIREAVQAEVDQPFDLARGPLVRATLFVRHAEAHVLVLVLHHSIFDAWSSGVLIRELTTFYRSFHDNQPSPLAPLPLQYADYTLWQRQWLSGAVLDQQLQYWREHLADVSPLELPTDRPRPPIATFGGGHQPFALPAELSTALERLSQQLGATLFMTMLAAWQVVLRRWSGQDDIVVGTPIAGRVRPELEALIGFFTNTLVLRTDLSGAPSFAEVVARTRAVALDAYAHQDVPFEVVVEQVQPTRDLSRTPLFQVMFILQNMPQDSIAVSDLTLAPVEVEARTAKFDLVLGLAETPDGLQGGIEYATDLFDAATIKRMVAHYQVVLAALVANPQQSIARLSLLTEAEQFQLTTWNATAQEVNQDLRVHQLVERQAMQTPDAIAVVFGDETLSYADLDRRANQLAHRLRALGVGPDACVALALERSLDLAVAVLAVLKAGGAYLPLDPTYPEERLRFMLGDSGASVLLTQTTLIDRLPLTAAHVLILDTLTGLDQEPATAPAVRVEAEHLAYVLYTSGSTGTPKAVAMPHGPLVNLLAWQRGSTTVDASATTLQFAALSFDVAFQELFVTWTAGGTVRLVRDDERRDFSALLDRLARGEVQRLFLPFVALQHLADLAVQQQINVVGVQEIVTAGEQLQITPAITRLLTALPGATLHNHYGPTESHAVTAHILSGDPTMWPALPPIGRPIANTQIYLLDAQLQPVPIGVVGELYIGGVPLARGYLNRPAVTAERFVPDPFSAQPGTRMYRTGDLARYLPDGSIAYLGRGDQQIKLRGFRVEVGEIEAVLRQHPAVADAIVQVVEPQPGDKRLVAYVVGEQKNKEQRNKEQRTTISPSPTDVKPEARLSAGKGDAGGEGLAALLRAHVGARLPEYMVPSAFVMLDTLPLTPSGKVNRRALPAPDASAFASTTAQVGPRDAWEWWLVERWSALLQVPSVGIHDDFFALGGHSLLAVRVLAEIRQQFGQALPLTTLLQAPTIAQLAAHLRHSGAELAWSPLVPLQPGGERSPFFAIHPGGGTVFCYADLARALGPDQPFYGIQARGLEAGQTPHSTVVAMATEYLAAIQTVQPHGPYQLGGWSFGGLVAFEIARQLREQGEEVSLLALIDSFAPTTGEPALGGAALAAAFARDLGGLFGKPLAITPAELELLTDDQRLSYVLAEAQRQQVLPPDIDLDQLRRLANVFYANLAMLHTYTPAPTTVPIALLEVDRRAQTGSENPLAEGWRTLTPNVESQTVAGTHYTLLRSPQVQAVAEWLGRLLAPHAAPEIC